jgi:ubiquinone biosynthesis protein UbiJ
MRLKFVDKMIRIEELPKDDSVAADVELHGRAFDLFQFGIRHGKMHDPAKHPVYFKGDVRLGREVQALFSELDLDWEGQLSSYIGDVPAHCVARLAGGLKDIKNSWMASVSDNVQQYIANETSCVVLKDESKLLSDEISDLRDSVDRFELRANQLLAE